ncbi:hypothetical protein [Hymenobacter jeollabukensis]|uniref:Uncharacterized protein n=1 Tax=Hymenobacter jeollabukensis TaxID=2025313 RepID=A0A5R8WL81_9BACT|nr:hypothetical protein [Hymenobacter jeollabukensis]TLM89506.1 hypothetical protein FDY95_20760 [Hymenobacter jeollabukensis]
MNIPNTNLPQDAFDHAHALNGWNGPQGGAGVATCYSGHVLYAVPDSNHDLQLLSSDTAAYRESHSFADLNHWKVTDLAKLLPKALQANLKVGSPLTIASLGGYNYVFWASGTGGGQTYHALRARPDLAAPPELTTIDLSNVALPSADYTLACTSNLGVVNLPDYRPDLAGKLGIVFLGTRHNSTGMSYSGRLYCLVLDPAAFVPNGRWVPQDFTQSKQTTVNYVAPGDADGSQLATGYTNISAGSYTQGTFPAPAGGTNPSPVQYVQLVVVCRNPSTADVLSLAVDLGVAFDMNYRAKAGVGGSPSAMLVTGPTTVNPNSGVTLSPAPDGNLLATYYNASGYVAVDAFNPSTTSDAPAGLHSPAWTSHYTSVTYKDASHNTPCSVFVPLAATTGPSPCPVPAADSDQTQTYPDCLIQNFVQLTFFSNEQHVPSFYTLYWGCIFAVRGYRTGTLKPGADRTQLTLLADTFPYPVPSPDVWGADSPSGMVNWALSSYEYLVGNDQAVDLTYNMRSSVGIKASETTLALGVGNQTDFEASVGFSQVLGHSAHVRQATSFTVAGKALPAADPDAQQLLISGDGAYFGMKPPATLYVDTALVLRRDATTPTGTRGAVVRPRLDDSIAAAAGDFRSYCYQPGNLLSYEPEAIGATMKSLYDNYAHQDQFVIDGQDYGALYSGGNYLAKVVEEFGSNVFGPNNNLPYLEYSFSETGVQRSEYQSTTAFTLGGSAFIDGSFYTGLAWDQEEEVGLDFIVEVEAEAAAEKGFLLLGAKLSSELGASATTGHDWGLKLTEFLNPLAPGEAYTVRLYLLKPSLLWSRELAAFGQLPAGSTVDSATSLPVRILFSVHNISAPLAARLQG